VTDREKEREREREREREKAKGLKINIFCILFPLQNRLKPVKMNVLIGRFHQKVSNKRNRPMTDPIKRSCLSSTILLIS
jgi:hypothetical protein